jgi:hypothetical protein
MLSLWTIPRRSYELFARLFGLYPTPPLYDHIEFVLLLLSLHGALFPQSNQNPSKLFLILSVIALHLQRGTRWQLYLLYMSIFVDTVFPHYSFSGIISVALLSISIVMCILFPMVPPLLSTDHQDVGVQDICLEGKTTKFWVRFYYPSLSPSVDTMGGIARFFQECFVDIILMGAILQYCRMKNVDLMYLIFFWFWHFLFEIGEHVIFRVRKVGYLPDHTAHLGIAKYSKLPQILFSHMQLFTICGIEDGEVILKQSSAASRVPSKAMEDDTSSSSSPKDLKVAFVLHGLSGYRSTYTSTCLSLVSKGYFVISPEFGDSTPASSLLPDGFVRYYHQFMGSLKSQQYHDFRQTQLEHRVHEMNTIMEFLQSIMTGSDLQMNKFHPHIRWKSLVPSSSSSSSSLLSSSSFVRSLQTQHLNLQDPLVIGHSFGGANAIYLASNISSSECQLFRKRYGLGCLVLYDPWMFPLSDSLREGIETIYSFQTSPSNKMKSIPVLCLHAEKFQWPENLEFENQVIRMEFKSKSLLKQQQQRPHHFIYQIRLEDAGHMNYTEASYLAPYLMNKMKSIGVQDPDKLLCDINEITVEFIKLIQGNHQMMKKKRNQNQQDMKRMSEAMESPQQIFERKLSEKKNFTLLYSKSPGNDRENW